MELEHTTTFNTCHKLKHANHNTHTFVDAFGPLEIKCQDIELIFKKSVLGKKPETLVTRTDTGVVYTNVSKFCQ